MYSLWNFLLIPYLPSSVLAIKKIILYLTPCLLQPNENKVLVHKLCDCKVMVSCFENSNKRIMLSMILVLKILPCKLPTHGMEKTCMHVHTHTHTHTQSYLLFYISCFLVSIVFNSLSIYLSSCQPPFNFFSFTVFSLIFLSTHHLSHYMSVHHVHHSHIQYILECLLCARSVKKDFNFF